MRKKHTMLLSLCCSESRPAITETGTAPRRVLPLLRRVEAALRFTSRRLVLSALLGCAVLFFGGEALGADPTGTLRITPSGNHACIVYEGSGIFAEEVILLQNYVLVGATVRADTSGISDSDGMTTPNWEYKWKRLKASDGTETVVGTGETYEVKVADWSASYWYHSATYLVLEATYTDDGNNEHTVLTSNEYNPGEDAYRIVRPVSPPVPTGWNSSYAWSHPRNPEKHTVYVYNVPEGSSSVTLGAEFSEYGAGPADYRSRDTRGTMDEWDKDRTKFENNYPNTKSPTFKFKEAPDFEEPNDENGDNDYRLAIAMRDSGADDGGRHGTCTTGWRGEDTKVYPIKIRVTDALEQDDLLDTPLPPELESAISNSATVAWTAPGRRDPVIPQATGYELEWRKAPSDQVPDPAVQKESLTATTKTLSGLQESTNYEVRVRATNGYAGSPWSDWLSFTTPQRPVLSSRGAAPESVTLEWTVPNVNGIPPGTTYDLEYRKEGDHSTQKTESGLTTTTKTLEGLQPGVTYEARVRVSPDGPWSEWHTFTTPEKREDEDDDEERETEEEPGNDDEERETEEEPGNDDEERETEEEPGNDDEERETEEEPGDDDEETEDSCPDPPGITAQYLENNQDRETLKGFVKEALCPISAELEASGQEGFEEQNYREEGHWKHGSVYLFLISDDGTVVFDGFHEELNGKELLAEDHKGNDVWDKISAALEGDGYAEYYWDDPSTEDDNNKKPQWLEDGESPGTSLKTVYVQRFSTDSEGDFIIGSGIYVEEEEEKGPVGTGEPMEEKPKPSGEDGGGGCTVAGSEMKSSALGLFPTLVLFCTVLRRGWCW